MKRTPFKRRTPAAYAQPERAPLIHKPLTIRVNQSHTAEFLRSIVKEAPVRSESYRRLVAAMPCAHCGIVGHSQAAHADFGKGARIKSDDRTCYPACGPRPDGSIGCHSLIGSTGAYSRDDRRRLESEYAAQTRNQIRISGRWPVGLPYFEDETELELIP